jgi:hypothetical protein
LKTNLNNLGFKASLKDRCSFQGFSEGPIIETSEDIFSSQEACVQEIVNIVGLERLVPIFTPLTAEIILMSFEAARDKQVDRIKYAQLLGCLMHVSNWARPDMSYALSTLSQFPKQPSEIHWEQAKRILKYLKITVEDCLWLPPKGKNIKAIVTPLNSFTESDWAGWFDTRKSRTGPCISFGSRHQHEKRRYHEALAKQSIMQLLRGRCIYCFFKPS